jgi:hypothetical protein
MVMPQAEDMWILDRALLRCPEAQGRGASKLAASWGEAKTTAYHPLFEKITRLGCGTGK